MMLRRQILIGVAAICAAPKSAMPGTSQVHEVAINAFAFEPEHIEARPGDIIRWTNHDLAPHTATADEFGWDTEEIVQHTSAEITVTADMETSYFCAFHPHMKGTITVK